MMQALCVQSFARVSEIEKNSKRFHQKGTPVQCHAVVFEHCNRLRNIDNQDTSA